MATCLIALGSNLGDRAANLQAAIGQLRGTPGVDLLAVSEFLETPPIGGPHGQGLFLNAAAKLQTGLSPLALARRMQEIEADLGRRREDRWNARTIDLDLLLYDQLVCRTDQLQLPHPRMTFRRFVLAPAVEVAADLRHPSTGKTLGEHLDWLDNSPPMIAFAAPESDESAAIADRVADKLSGVVVSSTLDESTDSSRVTASSTAAAGGERPWTIISSWPLPNVSNGVDSPRLLVVFESTIDAELAAKLSDFAGAALRIEQQTPFEQAVDEIVAAALASVA